MNTKFTRRNSEHDRMASRPIYRGLLMEERTIRSSHHLAILHISFLHHQHDGGRFARSFGRSSQVVERHGRLALSVDVPDLRDGDEPIDLGNMAERLLFPQISPLAYDADSGRFDRESENAAKRDHDADHRRGIHDGSVRGSVAS